MLLTILVNYFGALAIGKYSNHRKLALIAIVVYCLIDEADGIVDYIKNNIRA